MPSPDRVGALAAQLRNDAYAVLPGQLDADRGSRIRAALVDLHESLGCPPLYADYPEWLGEDLEVSETGLVFHKLLKWCPEIHRDILDPEIVAIVRGALGDDAELEFVGAVICDHTRPFFQWHNHIGGIEDEVYRRRGLRPPIDRAERIAVVHYLDALRPGSGQLLIYPRRINGAAPPPAPVDATHWDGQLEVEGPPGTVVLMDQTTWHAALPRGEGLGPRHFFGLWFKAADAPASERVDESLRNIHDPGPLLRSLLPAGGHD